MNHNDRLTRLRYGLDIKDDDMVEIFAMGGVSLSKENVQALLKKQVSETTEAPDVRAENVYEIACSDEQFERFLNGLIISQRGAKDAQEPVLELNHANANNLMLKKIKIALTLTSDDIHDILSEAGLEISNSELSAVLRREGHRNYKPCGDRYIRNFLKGLALRYR